MHYTLCTFILHLIVQSKIQDRIAPSTSPSSSTCRSNTRSSSASEADDAVHELPTIFNRVPIAATCINITHIYILK